MEATMVNNRTEERVKAIARLMLLVFMISMLFLGNVMEVSAAGEMSSVEVETGNKGFWWWQKPEIKIQNNSREKTQITVFNNNTWRVEQCFPLKAKKSTTITLKPNARYTIISATWSGSPRKAIRVTGSSKLNWW